MRYFNYEAAAREAGISDSQLAALSQLMRQEFPKDDMLYELHVLRACMAVRGGYLTIAEALKAKPAAKSLRWTR
ncbi:MAG: hypothetical protein HY796_06265 [Elusimicrobia bacterium]|nr:hypothetical protein [Elusimicrobiota bacterium]